MASASSGPIQIGRLRPLAAFSLSSTTGLPVAGSRRTPFDLDLDRIGRLRQAGEAEEQGRHPQAHGEIVRPARSPATGPRTPSRPGPAHPTAPGLLYH